LHLLKQYFAMKRFLVTLALVCLTIGAYGQRDIPAGGCMDVASVETNDTFGDHVGTGKEVTLYKVKDNEGNPSFFLCISQALATFSFGTEDLSTVFTLPGGGVMLDFGTTYQDALDSLETLLDLFDEKDGAQKELACRDGSTIVCTLHKAFLGKHLSIGDTSLTKSDIKGLRTGLKISKKLHPDL